MLLQHHELGLLLLIQHVDAAIVGGGGDATWEVRKLIQLVEVLGTLEEDLLVIVQVVVGVDVCVSEQVAVLLEVSDLVV